ncbi:MAG: glycosyl hydrolase [Steroidobacteraceae bacterium]
MVQAITRGRPRPALSIASLLAVACLWPAWISAQSTGGDPLASGFANPPNSARPRVWWHWMNGNITIDGIRKDIDWMSRVGIGGLQNFDAALQTPQIVPNRLAYMTPEWKNAFRFATEYAQDKGLELTIAASPGWSETGGPWVEPKDGMKKLVWSETEIAAAGAIVLPAPPSTTGPFQDLPIAGPAADTGKPPLYYRDVAVIALPVAGASPAVPAEIRDSAGKLLDAARLTDGKLLTGVEIPPAAADAASFVEISYASPQVVGSATLGLAGAGATSLRPELQVLEGQSWRKVAEFKVEASPTTTVSFAPLTGQRFRMVFSRASGPAPVSERGGVPGAVRRVAPPAAAPTPLLARELWLSTEPRVDRWELKGGFGLTGDYYGLKTTAANDRGADPKSVMDLTGKMTADGRLDWTPPPGRWRILRFGYSLSGKTNHPATAEATGLEVDKFEGAAVARYIDTYLAMFKQTTGPELFGARGLRAILTDSIEVGASNWTPAMVVEFKRRRGYDPTPYLPVLTGIIVGDRARSDAFLYDFRSTLADLITDQHYRVVADRAHANGLKVYGEATETGRPTLGDDIDMRRYADIPMAALWAYTARPRQTLLADLKGAASVAHVYGQNLAAAESLTSEFSPWAYAPSDLKRFIDLEFSLGINRPVIHTSVHQPVDDKVPGLSLGPFGQYFNRHETWAEMAKPWVDYMARSAFMLQQGRYFADVAYFYGEEAPLTQLFIEGPPRDAPKQYAYDFVSADGLINRLKVEGGDLTTPAGGRYKLIYLSGSSYRMTARTLRRIAELAEAGATIVGEPPTDSPSLTDDPAAFAALARRLWSGAPVTTVGHGRVIRSKDVERALASIGVKPDVAIAGRPDAEIMFLHRKVDRGDIYYLNNRENRAEQVEVRFRVQGFAPEIWRPETGRAEPVSYRFDGDETIVPLNLAPEDAFFVVFRKPSASRSVTVQPTQWTTLATVAGAWEVTFQPNRGAPSGMAMASLHSFTEEGDPGIKYFSGTSIYRKSVSVPAAAVGQPLMLDLGGVGDIAEVLVNGRSAGYAWKAPYRVDIGGLVHADANSIEVRVANVWVNRLIGDVQPGANKIAFTSAATYEPDAALRPAGLLGPVTLVAPKRR